MAEILTTPRAYSVKRLSELWDCSPKHIYNLIDRGDLRAFSIGKRGMRVTVAEAERWEKENNARSLTATATSSSAAERPGGLPTYAMKSLARGLAG